MAIRLSAGVGPYDRTLPLMAGLVETQGIDFSFATAPLEELFARAFDEVAFDVAELSFSNFLYLTSIGECPYIGLPIFPSRSFRHSAIYIRSDRGIESPQDLAGKVVGVREYSMTAALVARGLLEDEYGVRSQDVSWRYGPADSADSMPIVRVRPRGVDLQPIDQGRDLSSALLEGELDAMIAYKPPKITLGEASGVVRMFPDFPAVEADYASRTGIFPIMHLIGIRPELVEQDPSLIERVCTSFEHARQYASVKIGESQAPFTVLPWGAVEAQRVATLLGGDYWSYGVAKNRAALEALCRYSYAQGITDRELGIDELFPAAAQQWVDG